MSATRARGLMDGKEFRESLRQYKPTVYVDGDLIESVVDAPSLQPRINALAVTYDFAHDPALAPLMLAKQTVSGKTVNRMLHINESAGDLLNKLETVRLLCQETGCAQRYLNHDALNGIGQAIAKIDDAKGSTEYGAKFSAYLQRHPITHNSSIPHIHGTADLQRDGKRSDLLQAFPDRLGTGVTVVFAPEKPAKAGDQPHHLTQGG